MPRDSIIVPLWDVRVIDNVTMLLSRRLDKPPQKFHLARMETPLLLSTSPGTIHLLAAAVLIAIGGCSADTAGSATSLLDEVAQGEQVISGEEFIEESAQAQASPVDEHPVLREVRDDSRDPANERARLIHMARSADLIVLSTVTSVASRSPLPNEHYMGNATTVRITVSSTAKGSAPEELTINQPAGRRRVVDGSKAVFFLEKRDYGWRSLGTYPVRDDGTMHHLNINFDDLRLLVNQ